MSQRVLYKFLRCTVSNSVRSPVLFCTSRCVIHRSVSFHIQRTMKPATPRRLSLKSIFTPELGELENIFRRHGYELRIAGGAVRDLLSDKVPSDLDFATTATPDEMKKVFETENIRMINRRGEQHGTVTCRINDKENFEVTTLRIDVRTDGRHAEVQFTTDWQLDAARRDLTVNSMFLGLDGTLYDYFGGERDLLESRVSFVGDPGARIREDFLRILRYFRFYGRIAKQSCEHDSVTLKAIRENADGLQSISGERIWVEVKKIAVGRYADDIFRIMAELGVTNYIGFPSDMNFDELTRVYQKCWELDVQPMTVMSALLHTEDEVFTVL